MRGNNYDLSCFLCYEGSQASYIQDESITPQYIQYVLERSISIRLQK